MLNIVVKFMKLYYHKTDRGAEYLMDKYIVCPNGDKEGTFEGSTYIVRIDGDITKDAELAISDPPSDMPGFEGTLEALNKLSIN